MNKTLLVAKETYRREVKSWSYVLMIFAPFIFAAISIGAGYLSSNGGDNYDYVGVVTDVQPLKKEFKNSDDFENYSSLAKVKKDFRTDDIDGYVVIKQVDGQLQAVYHSTDKLDDDVKAELTSKLQAFQQRNNLAKAKLSTKQTQALSVQPKFTQKINKNAEHEANDDDSPEQSAFFSLVLILYLLVLTYTQVTAQDIATEKGTKVMEMIFSSMPGKSYFDGKILGIFGEIITQIVIYLAGGTIFYFTSPHIDGLKDVFSSIKPMIDQTLGHIVSWGLVFVILGLVLYVVCSAFCGALAFNPQNANKAVQPVMYVAIIGFFAAMALQNSPTSMVTKVLSYVPFLSSFLMPLRVIYGDANNIEAGVSALILLIFVASLFVVIRKIYPSSILQTEDQSIVNNFKRALKSR